MPEEGDPSFVAGLPSTFGSYASDPSMAPASDADVGPFAVPDHFRYADAVEVGQGGMGTVEAVFDQRLGRTVARKIVLHGSEEHARFAREARITAQLEHPGIVQVFDAGMLDDGRPFYTMQLIRGRSLKVAIAEAEQPLDLVRAVLTVANAVAYAHDNGVIHRDLKPSNIMVGTFGETQVVDWGLAARLDDVEALAEIVGTPSYMPPEQREGGATDKRSDVFGLGGVLRAVIGEQGPPELRAVVARCTEPDPEARYADAAEVAAELTAWLDGRRVQAHDYAAGEILGLFWQRYKRRIVFGTALGLTGVAVAVATTVTIARERAAAEAALLALREETASDRLDQDAFVEAAAIARDALALGDSPIARGVLAGVPPTAPEVVFQVACDSPRRSGRARTIYCVESDGLYTVGSDRQLVHPVEDLYDVVVDQFGLILHSKAGYHRMDGTRLFPKRVSGRLTVDGMLPDPENVVRPGFPEERPACGDSSIATVATDGRYDFALCRDSTVWRAPRNGPFALLGTAPPTRGWLSMDATEGFVVLGGSHGQLTILDTDGTVNHDLELPLRGVSRVRVANGRIAASAHSDGTVVLCAYTGQVLARLPDGERVVDLDGELITEHDGIVRWWSMPELSALRYRAMGGLTGILIDGDAMIGFDGTGYATRWRLSDGRILARRRIDPDVLKPGTLHDGILALSSTGDQGHRVDPKTLENAGPPIHGGGRKRQILSTGEELFAVTYGFTARRLDAEHADVIESGVYRAVEIPGGFLAVGEGVRRYGPAGIEVLDTPAEVRRAAWDGEVVWATTDTLGWGVHRVPIEAPATSLWAGEGLRAVGMLDGRVRVFTADGVERYELRGHVEQVSDIERHGDTLLTASWDGTVRRWWGIHSP